MIRCRNSRVRGCVGLAEDPVRRTLLEDEALVEEDDAVGDVAREAHLVGGDEHRHPLGGELADDVQHLADELGIERAGHLVEQQQRGIHGQCADDRHALLLAAGEAIGIVARACRPGRIGRAARRPAPRPRRAAGPGRDAAPGVTLSSTDMCGKRLKVWNTIPMCRRMRSTSTPSAVISSPPTTMRPASIGSRRLMQRSSVDLPEPDAPMTHTTSCSATRQVDPAQHLELAERLVQPFDVAASAADQRLIGRSRRACDRAVRPSSRPLTDAA